MKGKKDLPPKETQIYKRNPIRYYLLRYIRWKNKTYILIIQKL